MRPKARREKLLIQEIGDEIVVYDQQTHTAHRLNSAAAFVWQHSDGNKTTAEIARLLHQKHNLSNSEDVVRLGVLQLHKAGLLESIPAESNRLSRRSLIAGLRTAGVAAFLIPAVTSLAAPVPAAAVFASEDNSSGGSSGGSGGSGTSGKPPANVFPGKNENFPPVPASGTTVDGYTICSGSCPKPSLTNTVIECNGLGAKCKGDCKCHLFEADPSATASWEKSKMHGSPADLVAYNSSKVYACFCAKSQ